MQSITLVLAAVLACAYSQAYIPEGYAEQYPDYYELRKVGRHPRDLTWDTKVGQGTVFGTLGSTDDSLFGKGGYRQDIFDDHRGKLQGEAYGTRVLGANGDSTLMGGKLDWSNDNARLGADLHREIGGRSGVTVTGEGVWKLDKDTRFVTGGSLNKNFGHDRPEFGVQARIEHDI